MGTRSGDASCALTPVDRHGSADCGVRPLQDVEGATTVPFGAATLDRATRHIRSDDTEFTELELRLAEYFVQRPNEIVRREALPEDVWGVSLNS